MRSNNKEYILRHIVVGLLETNCYIFGSAKTKEVILIDPGDDYEVLSEVLNKEQLKAVSIVSTHGHMDHTGANSDFNLPIYIHKDDAAFLTEPSKNLSAFCNGPTVSPEASHLLKDEDTIDISGLKLQVIHTPGHTPGGISLHYNGIVFTGDTLFAGGIGRTDLPYGDHEQLMRSIKERLLKLDDDVIIYPGHGGTSTIGKERKQNPWL